MYSVMPSQGRAGPLSLILLFDLVASGRSLALVRLGSNIIFYAATLFFHIVVPK
jgi:hypothetical protein